MGVLADHRKRVKDLRDALDSMISLHDQLYSLANRISASAQGEEAHRAARNEPLHQRARELSKEITALRRRTFGELNHDSELNIASLVESSRMDAVAGDLLDEDDR